MCIDWFSWDSKHFLGKESNLELERTWQGKGLQRKIQEGTPETPMRINPNRRKRAG